VLLGASLLVVAIPDVVGVFLPLLEQTFNTITIFFMVWALVPHVKRLPHLGHLLLLMGILISLALAVSFFPTWQTLAAQGIVYNSTSQATIWGVLQMVLLAAGLLLVVFNAQWRSTLSPIILLFLLLAHISHFWNYPEIIPTETNITYWIRLGHLVAFPLWAAMAYRQSLLPLLIAQRNKAAPASELEAVLLNVSQTVLAENRDAALQTAINLIASVVEATFIGVGLVDEALARLVMTSNFPQVGTDRPRSWELPVADWSILESAVQQKEWVALQPEGAGSGQLHRFYEELEIGPLGALSVQPMLDESQLIGLLFLGQARGVGKVPKKERELAPALASFIVSALNNVDRLDRQRLSTPILPVEPQPVMDETAVSGRIIALEESRQKLQEQLDISQSRLMQTEKRATASSKRAHDLAAMLEEMERVNPDERLNTMTQEIETLRDSLIEAEEAMALASAGEGGLSAEWVMLTITRYSGQLEEAQERIHQLEESLSKHDYGSNEIVTSLVQELRTPMTSIAGYTDILLAERIGILGVKQRDFVHRVQANVARMNALLEQIVQFTTGTEPTVIQLDQSSVNVEDAIETAVTAVITQLREKNLRLELNIPANLPSLSMEQKAMRQIMASLLGNACQSSRNESRIAVTVRTNVLPIPSHSNNNGQTEPFQFMHLAVTDSGGGIRVGSGRAGRLRVVRARLPRWRRRRARADDHVALLALQQRLPRDRAR